MKHTLNRIKNSHLHRAYGAHPIRRAGSKFVVNFFFRKLSIGTIDTASHRYTEQGAATFRLRLFCVYVFIIFCLLYFGQPINRRVSADDWHRQPPTHNTHTARIGPSL